MEYDIAATLTLYSGIADYNRATSYEYTREFGFVLRHMISQIVLIAQ